MPKTDQPRRRDFVRGVLAVGVAGLALPLVRRTEGDMVWQIDPDKCSQCGRCATHCVLSPSAVKCIHSFSMCGYCDLCGGYLRPDAKERDTGAENQLCPTGAIRRNFIENPYFQYTIDTDLCIGCAKCVKGCDVFGNGSLYLQIDHSLCAHCNECSIARSCPSEAFVQVPVRDPYRLKSDREKRVF